MTLEAVLAAYPTEVPIPAGTVADAVAASNADTPRVLVVLDDDPTGTQSVADLPVLTRWDVEDFIWAFGQSKPPRLHPHQHPQPGSRRSGRPQ